MTKRKLMSPRDWTWVYATKPFQLYVSIFHTAGYRDWTRVW